MESCEQIGIGGERMSNVKNSSIPDFLVTFFVGERAISKTLSDILRNRTNPLFLEVLGLPLDFILPFFQEEVDSSVVFYLRQECNPNYQVVVNDNPCGNHIIQSGDYFVFKNLTGNKTVKALFIATSDLCTGYRKYRLPKDTNIFFGRTSSNDISFYLSNFISREKHAAIHVDSHGNAFIEDLKRSVGVYVNGQMVHSQQLKLFDEVFIMGFSLVYMGDFIAVRNLNVESTLPLMPEYILKDPVHDTERKDYFISTPRILKTLDRDEIEIDAPPNPFTVDQTPAILTLGPTLTMSIVMLASLGVSIANAFSGGQISTIITSGIMAIGMLLGALMWPSLLRRYQKKRILAEEAHRKKRYTSYIADIEKELVEKRERAIRVLNQSLCPAPEMLCAMLDSESNRLHLWERSSEDSDFLAIRMGLGSRPSEIHFKIPRQGFQLYEDDLRKLPTELSQKYEILTHVPLTLDIRNNHTIGIIGSLQNIQTILNEIILNVMSLHPYDEAKLVFVTSPKRAVVFAPFKNIPHIWSNDRQVRFFATNPEEVHYIFNTIDEKIKDRESLQDKSAASVPHYVIIVTEPNLIEKEALYRYINDSNNQVGITTLFAYGDITKLPKCCKTIIQSDSTRTGYYSKNRNSNRFIPFTLDPIDMEAVYAFSDKLSRLDIKRDARSMGIADRISFLQMYKVGNVHDLSIESHWRNNNSAKSLAAPIGVVAGGDVFSLDLHEAYHGCHGLVAGTTGSGKSEFLQAFILSLAINYSPNEVAFVLVDFKGGDMARPFMEKAYAPALPHLSATISNLSGNILYRALVSLDAEIKSRQRIFNEAAAALGVDKLDINSYHKYYKSGRLDTPLPHLVIIIDEFAQLKTQQPEFLEQLINIAQVGRSLGIHLILATQKPNGIVDPQIMSNSRFKVCLKVADKQDSVDMISRPDSAMIKNPGRLYLQVGYDEVYECIQSGYSGADYIPTKSFMPDEEITVQMTDNTANPIHSAKMELTNDKSEKTQLEAVVAEIVALGQKYNLSAKPLWLNVLPEKVLLSSLKKETRGLCSATIGLADFVRTQEQKPLIVDLVQAGHIGLYGASGTGKTTFLQTMVYSMVCEYGYSPAELNLYAMDFGGRNLGYLSHLPHTGGVVFADEADKIYELISTLQGIIDERKRLFADHNCGTFRDYRAVCHNPLPAVLVLIDNFAAFREKYMDISDAFIDIISAAKAFGVYFVITGNTRNSIYYKVTEHIATYFTLKMNDPGNYLDILNVRPPIIPEDISGRGITVINREVIEFQTAIAFNGETESDRMTRIADEYQTLKTGWKGYLPILLSGSDENVKEAPAAANTAFISLQSNPPESVYDDPHHLILGTSKSGALTYGIPLSQHYKICICANGSNDLRAFYKNLLEQISSYSDRKAVFIDDEIGTYKGLVENYSTFRYISGCSALETFIEDLKPELNARLENPEAQHMRLFVVIAEFNSFFRMISDVQAAFMRKVVQYMNDPKYQIYFICGFDVNGDKNNDRLFMSLIVNAESYLICPFCYEKASKKIETLPFISDIKPGHCYFCLNEKSTDIRW